MLTRRIARPLMASVFITGGIDVLRNPGPRVKKAEPVTSKLSETLPLPDDPEQLVKLNGILHVGFGILLFLNKLPRLSAAVLAVTLIPTTAAGHRFWEEEDPQMQKNQQAHFFKNLGLLGGLIIAATDKEGAPSLSWRARRAAKKAKRREGERGPTDRLSAELLQTNRRTWSPTSQDSGPLVTHQPPWWS